MKVFFTTNQSIKAVFITNWSIKIIFTTDQSIRVTLPSTDQWRYKMNIVSYGIVNFISNVSYDSIVSSK